jgi:hypothetical protein
MIKLTALVLSRRHYTITNALFIILVIYLSGCATNKPYEIELMPAPDIYEKGLIDPFNDRNLHVINVTQAEGAASGNGHAYFRKSPWASSDILVSLLYNLKPAERALEKDAELPIWTFPPDYIQKLQTVLMSANPELPKDVK